MENSKRKTGGGPGLTVLYSATLSSNYSRGNRIMGHDATMMMGGQSNVGNVGGFIVTADSSSTQYRDRLQSGVIKNVPDNTKVMGYPAIPLKDFVKQRKKNEK